MKDERSPEQQLGERLREVRSARKISQSQLAEAMALRGFSWGQTTTTKTEHGDRPVRYNEVVALAEVLGVPLEALTTRDEAEGPTLLERVRADAELKQAHERLRAARSEVTDAEAEWELAWTRRRTVWDEA